ncbi:hypothetical protein B2J88_14805 [Rhodococcus sp. SRB_17]|nr:hypothetical protein [Rhodococcus sp. SRB_17]
MLLSNTTRLVMRTGYRMIRIPLRCIDEQILPTFLDETAHARLAYQRLLIECDRIAAAVLDDPSAAALAARVDQRNAVVRYGIARHQRQIQCETDAVLAGHRARFLRSQHRHGMRWDGL